MTWSVLQSAVGTGTATTAAATFGTNLSSGTKLVAYIQTIQASGSSPTSVKDGAGNNFTQRSTADQSTNGGQGTEVWTLDTPAGDVGTKPTITATWTTSQDNAILVQEVSGLLADASGPLDGTPGTKTGGGTALTSPIATPAYSDTAVNEFAFILYADNGIPTTITTPSGWTADSNNINNSATGDLCVFTKNSVNGAESANVAFSGSFAASDGFGLILGAFKLAAAAATPFNPRAMRSARRPPRLPARGSMAHPWQGSGISQPPIPPVSVRDYRRPVRIPDRGSMAHPWQGSGVFQPPIPPVAIRDARREPRGIVRGSMAHPWQGSGVSQPPIPPAAVRDTRRPVRLPPPRFASPGFEQGISQPPIIPQALRDMRRQPRIPPRSNIASWEQGISQPPVPPAAVRDYRRPARFPLHQAVSPPSPGFTPPAAARSPQPLPRRFRPPFLPHWQRSVTPVPPQAAVVQAAFAPQSPRPLRRVFPRRGSTASWARGISQPPLPPQPPVLAAPHRIRAFTRWQRQAQWAQGISQPPQLPPVLAEPRPFRPALLPRWRRQGEWTPPQVIIPPAVQIPTSPRWPWFLRAPWWVRRSRYGYLPGPTSGIVKGGGQSSVSDPRDGVHTVTAAGSGSSSVKAAGSGRSSVVAAGSGVSSVTDPRDGIKGVK